MPWGVILSILSLLGFGAIVCWIITSRISKMEARSEAAAEKREKSRAEQNELILNGLKATGHLGEATAMAVRDNKINGEMTTALGYYYKWRDDLNAHLIKSTVAHNNQGT